MHGLGEDVRIDSVHLPALSVITGESRVLGIPYVAWGLPPKIDFPIIPRDRGWLGCIVQVAEQLTMLNMKAPY